MCERCKAEVNGVRSGKGTAVFSTYILGMRACKHERDCSCKYCDEYRPQNPYSNTGLLV